ncbi:MAG: hypothetical protein CSA20_08040 [Deltaproteobacteria bacterium]|nr:MAG: hypothetical protein CSA20_08040 [Deltaproteobacteria bacterium]
MVLVSSCSKPPEEVYAPPPAPVVIKRDVNIISSPPGASIAVDHVGVGKAPLSYTFNFSDKAVYSVSAALDNYLPVEAVIDVQGVDSAGGTLQLHLNPHPFVAVTSLKYPANEWIQVPMTPEVLEYDFWERLIRIVRRYYPGPLLAQMEPGIIESKFVTMKYPVGEHHEFIRSRLKTRFQEKYPKVIMGVYIETETSVDGVEWISFHPMRNKDVELIDTLRKKMGVHYYLNTSPASETPSQ